MYYSQAYILMLGYNAIIKVADYQLEHVLNRQLLSAL